MTNQFYRPLTRVSAMLLLILLTLACSLSNPLAKFAATPTPIPTRRILPTFTPTLANMVTVTSQAENTPPTQATPIPTIEPSPTPPPPPTDTPTPAIPVVILVQDMNVRGGPGTNYPVIGPGPAGSSTKILGRNADSSWLQVEYPPDSGNPGWVYASLVQIQGNLDAIAVAQAPPLPPTPTPLPTPVPVPTTPKYQFTPPPGWYASKNEGICHFRGTIRDEAGNKVSGYSVLLDNGAYSVISHPSSASHHYPEKPDGEWDVAGIPLKDCVGWWWLTVVRYDCPDFLNRYDAQCKQFTRLSESIKIMVNWPDETVIWADWTCHWDCDKGIYTVPYRKP